ncbi:MAG: RNA polymerase sigma-54 factor [Alphaproteobacteria bacterium]|nr:RNA polymerase sigma-54 factor [Alphaproteobacteria bacterium]
MTINQRLDLRQSQSLVMTPQLQQAIKLLQLSNQELSEYVEREIEQNPLLERDDRPEPDVSERTIDTFADGAPPASASASDASVEVALGSAMPGAGDSPVDTSDANLYESAEDYLPWRSTSGGSDFDEDGRSFEETTAAKAPTLREHLFDQLSVDIEDPVDRLIGSHLIDLLDESGYLVGDLDEIAGQLGCAPERVMGALELMQRFDPAGVFARSLGECLALQLAERGRLDPAMQVLIDRLDLLAKRDLNQLMKLCQVDAADMKEMIAEIKTLNPKPGSAFDQSIVQAVVPDIVMRPQPDGDWVIELNSETLPKVLVNTRYYARITKDAKNKEEKDYLSEHYQAANWLVKSLHQRATTILKVASEIIRQQDAFFRRGVQHLRPLILRDIADAISMHESTVSRVTTNKHMATPRGLFELKYFFTASIQSSSGGEAHSAEAVRSRIKTLIDAEKLDDVLSDDKLVELLRSDGVVIARRTVAKYREAMKIPSSVQRRRDKAMQM